MTHTILEKIPYQRITSQQAHGTEIFDLYACGLFKQNNRMENIEIVALQDQAHYQPHFHAHSEATIYIIFGEGQFVLGNDCIPYTAGSSFHIPAGVLHGFDTQTKTLFLSIQSPPIIQVTTGEIDLHYPAEATHAAK